MTTEFEFKDVSKGNTKSQDLPFFRAIFIHPPPDNCFRDPETFSVSDKFKH